VLNFGRRVNGQPVKATKSPKGTNRENRGE